MKWMMTKFKYHMKRDLVQDMTFSTPRVLTTIGATQSYRLLATEPPVTIDFKEQGNLR